MLPAFNPKCLLISALAVGVYWYAPKKSGYFAGLLSVGTYIGIAWYDELYQCNERLKPGLLSAVTGPFKPAYN